MNDCFISSARGRGRIRSRELGAVMGTSGGGEACREGTPGMPEYRWVTGPGATALRGCNCLDFQEVRRLDWSEHPTLHLHALGYDRPAPQQVAAPLEALSILAASWPNPPIPLEASGGGTFRRSGSFALRALGPDAFVRAGSCHLPIKLK